jgi:hypothetical protein
MRPARQPRAIALRRGLALAVVTLVLAVLPVAGSMTARTSAQGSATDQTIHGNQTNYGDRAIHGDQAVRGSKIDHAVRVRLAYGQDVLDSPDLDRAPALRATLHLRFEPSPRGSGPDGLTDARAPPAWKSV